MRLLLNVKEYLLYYLYRYSTHNDKYTELLYIESIIHFSEDVDMKKIKNRNIDFERAYSS